MICYASMAETSILMLGRFLATALFKLWDWMGISASKMAYNNSYDMVFWANILKWNGELLDTCSRTFSQSASNPPSANPMPYKELVRRGLRYLH